MNKFTAGPWERDKYGNVVNSNGESVAFRSVRILCSGSAEVTREAEANTTLLAAAPDLLHALEALCACITDTRGPDSFAALMAARKAIAKARGES